MEVRKKRAIDAVTPNFAKIVIENDKEDVIGQLLRGEYKMTPEEEAEFDRQCIEEDRQYFVKLKTELQTERWSDGREIGPVHMNELWDDYKRHIKFMIEEDDHVEWFDAWDKNNIKYIADDVRQYFNESKRRLQTGYWTENHPMNDVQTEAMQGRYDTILKLIIELGYTDWLDEWDTANLQNSKREV